MEMRLSCSATPPLMFFWGLGRTFFLTMATCSTSTLRSTGKTRSTRPSLPLSRPVMTRTVSLRRISTFTCGMTFLSSQSSEPGSLQHLGCEGDDLQEFLFAQLAGDRPEDARPDRLAGLVDEHGGVLVEADVGAILAAVLLAGAYDHRLHHFALLHLAVGRSFLHAGGDHVAEVGDQA